MGITAMIISSSETWDIIEILIRMDVLKLNKAEYLKTKDALFKARSVEAENMTHAKTWHPQVIELDGIVIVGGIPPSENIPADRMPAQKKYDQNKHLQIYEGLKYAGKNKIRDTHLLAVHDDKHVNTGNDIYSDMADFTNIPPADRNLMEQIVKETPLLPVPKFGTDANEQYWERVCAYHDENAALRTDQVRQNALKEELSEFNTQMRDLIEAQTKEQFGRGPQKQ